MADKSSYRGGRGRGSNSRGGRPQRGAGAHNSGHRRAPAAEPQPPPSAVVKMFWDLDGMPFSSSLLHRAKLSKKFPTSATLQDRNPVDAIIAIKRYLRSHNLCPTDAAFEIHIFHSPTSCTVKFRLSLAEREQLSREASLHDIISTGPDATCDAAHKALVGAIPESDATTILVLVAPKASPAAREQAAAASIPLHFFSINDFPSLSDKAISWEEVLAPVPFRAEDGTAHATREQLDAYVERALTLVQLPRAESRDALRQGILALFPGRYTVRMFLSSDFLNAQCLFESKDECEVALRPTYHGSADTSTAKALRAIPPVGMKASCLTATQLTALCQDADLEEMHIAPPPSPRKGVSYSAVLGPSARTTPEPTPAPAKAAPAPAPAAPAAPAATAAPVAPAASGPAATPALAPAAVPAAAPAAAPAVAAAAAAPARAPATTSAWGTVPAAKSNAPIAVIDHRSKGSARGGKQGGRN